MDDRRQLLHLLATLSYERRRVVLASGRESDFYVDGKQTTLHAQGAYLIGRLVLARIRGMQGPIVGVGGLTMGADPIATATSVASVQDGGPLVHAFYVRKDPKGHGTRQWVEGRRNLPDGSAVVIVEDTSTTGTSAWNAVVRAREEGLDVRAVITVVDREEGAREFIEAQGMPFFSLVGRRELCGELS
jgi:orotate phosphoribosyltransferase